jgi:hypothetical protein
MTVPEEEMYEKYNWPSKFNEDHKWSFTLKNESTMPKSVHVLDVARYCNDRATVEKIELINQFYYYNIDPNLDQTQLPNVECCIEIILRKK